MSRFQAPGLDFRVSMPEASVPSLLADHLAFLRPGLSINVGSCDEAGYPSLCRALGFDLQPSTGRLTVFLPFPQAGPLLRDLRSMGRIAVVFSEPATHRTLQFKGVDAQVAPAGPEAAARVAQCIEAFVAVLEPLGYSPLAIRTLLACEPGEITAVTFTPVQVFDQTPGPQAGAQVGGPA